MYILESYNCLQVHVNYEFEVLSCQPTQGWKGGSVASHASAEGGSGAVRGQQRNTCAQRQCLEEGHLPTGQTLTTQCMYVHESM